MNPTTVPASLHPPLRGVHKERFIAAPPGQAVYALSTSYCEAQGVSLLQALRHEAAHDGIYYMPQRYLRRSEDNGRTWSVEGAIATEAPERREPVFRYPPQFFLSRTRGRLIELSYEREVSLAEDQFEGSLAARTGRLFYRVSADGGKQWQPRRQVIHHGAGFDAIHWMPGASYGRNSMGGDLLPFEELEDGTLVFGVNFRTVNRDGTLFYPHGQPGRYGGVAFLLGRWDAGSDAIAWSCSDPVEIDPSRSYAGITEPDLVHLGGGRLFSTMRCQGDRPLGLFSSRQAAWSADGGKSWSPPRPLAYEDGEPVAVPASFARFVRGPHSGKVYWIANILDRPVYGQVPRYPLAIAELDPERLCLVRSSVREIQGLPAGAPACVDPATQRQEETGRRYTNFGLYTDRENGDVVLTLPEQPKTSWEDFTADCYRYRLPGL
ncbi:MAG TPA: sialidase family protein [Chthoniobacteraceae bacterium]|nr:sialidase family protein [Chthoniobacteraceae bacterium]